MGGADGSRSSTPSPQTEFVNEQQGRRPQLRSAALRSCREDRGHPLVPLSVLPLRIM